MKRKIFSLFNVKNSISIKTPTTSNTNFKYLVNPFIRDWENLIPKLDRLLKQDIKMAN